MEPFLESSLDFKKRNMARNAPLLLITSLSHDPERSQSKKEANLLRITERWKEAVSLTMSWHQLSFILSGLLVIGENKIHLPFRTVDLEFFHYLPSNISYQNLYGWTGYTHSYTYLNSGVFKVLLQPVECVLNCLTGIGYYICEVLQLSLKFVLFSSNENPLLARSESTSRT